MVNGFLITKEFENIVCILNKTGIQLVFSLEVTMLFSQSQAFLNHAFTKPFFGPSRINRTYVSLDKVMVHMHVCMYLRTIPTHDR